MADLLGGIFGGASEGQNNDDNLSSNAKAAEGAEGPDSPSKRPVDSQGDNADEEEEDEDHNSVLRNKHTNHILWKWFQHRRVQNLIQASKNKMLSRMRNDHSNHPISQVHGYDYFHPAITKAEKEWIDSFSEIEIEAVRLVQSHVRFWLAIKKTLRHSNRHTQKMSTLQVVQAAVRRYLAQQSFIKHLMLQRDRDKKFSQFCDLLKQNPDKKRSKDSYSPSHHANYPLTTWMYSRQKGDKSKRRIFIDDATWTKLCWKVNPYQTKSFELRRIYGIEKGQSETFYTAQPNQKSLCCHLLGKGDVFLDFEFETVELFKQFYDGFNRLIALYNGENSFYIDGFGVPRRSGPSVVEYASTDKPSRGFRSEADENRYRAALASLKTLYEDWGGEYKRELEEFKEKKKHEDKLRQRMTQADIDKEAAEQKELEDEEAAELATLHDTSTIATALHKRDMPEDDENIIDPDDPAYIAAMEDRSLNDNPNPIDSLGISLGLWGTDTFNTGRIQNFGGSINAFEEVDKGGPDITLSVKGAPMNDKDVQEAKEMQSIVSSKREVEDENDSIELNEIEIEGKTYLISYEGNDESNGILYEKTFDENGEEGVGDQVGAIVNNVPTFIEEDDSEVNALFSEKGSGVDEEVNRREDDGAGIDVWGMIGGFFGGASQAAPENEEVKDAPNEREGQNQIFAYQIDGFPCCISNEVNGPIYRKISDDDHGEQIGDLKGGVACWYPGEGPDQKTKGEEEKPKKKSIFGRIFGGKKTKPGAA